MFSSLDPDETPAATGLWSEAGQWPLLFSSCPLWGLAGAGKGRQVAEQWGWPLGPTGHQLHLHVALTVEFILPSLWAGQVCFWPVEGCARRSPTVAQAGQLQGLGAQPTWDTPSGGGSNTWLQLGAAASSWWQEF